MSEAAKWGSQEPDEGQFRALATAIPSGVIFICAQRVVWANERFIEAAFMVISPAQPPPCEWPLCSSFT
ncbi:MAG: hypothetical protein IH985_08135 [Planctomycetes bacterium]|nr:hypothetical protein [Planctomycetota bacterium]